VLDERRELLFLFNYVAGDDPGPAVGLRDYLAG